MTSGIKSSWRQAASGILQTLILGPMPFNLFTVSSHLDAGTDCALSKLTANRYGEYVAVWPSKGGTNDK